MKASVLVFSKWYLKNYTKKHWARNLCANTGPFAAVATSATMHSKTDESLHDMTENYCTSYVK